MEKTITMMICCPMRGLDNDQIRHSLMELQTFIIDEYNKYEHEVSIKFTDNFVNYSCPMLDHDDNGFRMFCLGNGIANVMGILSWFGTMDWYGASSSMYMGITSSMDHDQ